MPPKTGDKAFGGQRQCWRVTAWDSAGAGAGLRVLGVQGVGPQVSCTHFAEHARLGLQRVPVARAVYMRDGFQATGVFGLAKGLGVFGVRFEKSLQAAGLSLVEVKSHCVFQMDGLFVEDRVVEPAVPMKEGRCSG